MTSSPAPTRKLIAILSSDVVGYSRLMGDNERATLETLAAHRLIMAKCIADSGGRVVDSSGDALLAEFASSVSAVECAMAIQAELLQRNAALLENRQMHIRIGVNVGDVLEQDGALYGDGVNIAARLEALAEPGGVSVSRSVYENVRSKLPYQFDFMGKRTLKNIPQPVDVYRVTVPGSGRVKPSSSKFASPRFALGALLAICVAIGVTITLYRQQTSSPISDPNSRSSDRDSLLLPSIAVLPFQNMSGDGEDWFSDGLTETLITDLSKVPHLLVIARNSTFTYKGKSVDVRQVGRELGARYVMEGSVQRASDRLRVNVQLVEAQLGRHVWAQRYDRSREDIFDIQDDIAGHIAKELEVKLVAGEQARTWQRSTRNREAYDLYLQALALGQTQSQEAVAKSQELIDRALVLDPKFTSAIVHASFTHYAQGDPGWSPDPQRSYEKAVDLARRAIELDPSSGVAYSSLANTLLTLQRHAEGVVAAEKAIALSPNDANVIALSAWILALNGRAKEAAPLMERAFRLNPIPVEWYHGSMGDSLLFSGRVDDALRAHETCANLTPEFILCQLARAVEYVLKQRLNDAAAAVKASVAINAKITAMDNTYVRSIGVPADRQMVVDALRRAGLP